MGERRRKLVFAGAAAVLLGITVALTVRDTGPVDRRDARPERPADQSAIRTEPPAVSESGMTADAWGPATPASRAPSTMPTPDSATRPEEEPRNAPAVAPGDARAAAAAARAFLEGYLPYSYGRAHAERIRAAAAPLLRELEAAPPRVPASVARARPRLVSVRAAAATGGSDIDVVAVVNDGRRRYRIPLAVQGRGRRWVVTAVRG
jgi:hypothetical protein